MTARQIITLTTDFGTRDHYVAAVKAVILSIAPETALVDISHEVPPQAITSAAYLLESVAEYFPEGTVHIVVVDPGVGTNRLPVAIQVEGAYFVGPDNGVFVPVLAGQGAVNRQTGTLAHAEAVSLQNAQYRRSSVSNTFHGRDIFAPAAAHLARGVPLSNFGPAIYQLTAPPASAATRTERGATGQIVHVDHFGNLITDIAGEWLQRDAVIKLRGTVISGLSDSYQEREVAAIIGSSGRLEIAIRNGNAASALGLTVGDAVRAEAAP